MKRWYVIQVYAGYEDAIKANLMKSIREAGFEEYVGQILIPSAKLKSFFNAAEEKDEQLFPGYMLIEMEIVPGIIRLVTASLRVLRFLGDKEPIPLSQKEVSRVLSQASGEVVLSAEKSAFTVGSEIDIKEGPFAGFVGIVDKVDEGSERLTVMVSIFGRMTPVELGFNQVKQ
ncbi:MAG TPA: transcription termination/antitermination protein NusG [Candidatus Babeliales bacterium]|nr:transcription termination/antitermination protein NusG [Candidatus Babeliales bacterium]